MKTASELYELSQRQTQILVAKVLEGVREHIIMRCEEEANKGATHYSIYLKKEVAFVKECLLDECIKIAKEFENNGYEVYITDSVSEYWADFTITFSWDKNYKPVDFRSKFGLLYDTNNGKYKEEENN